MDVTVASGSVTYESTEETTVVGGIRVNTVDTCPGNVIVLTMN